MPSVVGPGSSAPIQSSGGQFTIVGTAGQTYTLPSTSATIARTDAAQTFTGIQTIDSVLLGTAQSGSAPGSLRYNASYGTYLQGKTGSSGDLALISNGNGIILYNPTGTTNLILGGTVTFSGTSSITSANGQALVLATGTSGTALSIASATNGASFAGFIAVGNATLSTSTALITPAGTTGVSSLRIPHGAAPTSPVNGDMWTTTSGLFIRINGATVGPLS